jgi:hypothetical protein
MFPHPSLSSLCRRAGALVCVALLAASCGGSKKNAHKPDTQSLSVPGSNVRLKLVLAHVDTAGPAVTLDRATKTAVMAQTSQYVNDAVVKPLLTGKPTAGYAALFGPTVSAAAATGTDRLALTDESVGKVSGNVNGPVTPVVITGLADTNGAILYVAANFDLNLSVKVQSTPVAIKRHTELTFDKSPNGKWYITAYRVVTTRLPRGGTPTTAVSNNAGKP